MKINTNLSFKNNDNDNSISSNRNKEEPFYFSDDELKNVPEDIKTILTCNIKQGTTR